MRNEWILVNRCGDWESSRWNITGYNWDMCEGSTLMFFPALIGKTKAKMKITRTRHKGSMKLELTTAYSTYYVRVRHWASNKSDRLMHEPTKKLKYMYPQLRSDEDIRVTVYVSITPID